ncbi:putative signal transducing protein [Terrihabitans sp. B22-R8]|uniref:putative signal transducing protein n=1 Tax=Terrihabitans sp. B22-R8 TaxID=3425128 RepID=UPI00403C09FB
MEELLRTNDLVLISFVRSLLDDDGVEHAVFDGNMSVLEGSLGVIARRVLVPADHIHRARRILRENGLGHELRPPR